MFALAGLSLLTFVEPCVVTMFEDVPTRVWPTFCLLREYGQRLVNLRSHVGFLEDKVKHCRVERSKKRKRRKIKRNKERRRAQKKLQRGRREQRETEKWTKILSTAVEVEKTLLEKRPLDRTSVDLTPGQLKLAKGKNLSRHLIK